MNFYYNPKLGDENGVSLKGRLAVDMLNHITNELSIGRRIKTGELRKGLLSPIGWCPPALK